MQDPAWKQITVKALPEQHDEGSCGVFICMYAKRLVQGTDVGDTFAQKDIPSLRLQIAADLLTAYQDHD